MAFDFFQRGLQEELSQTLGELSQTRGELSQTQEEITRKTRELKHKEWQLRDKQRALDREREVANHYKAIIDMGESEDTTGRQEVQRMQVVLQEVEVSLQLCFSHHIV